MSPRGGSTLTVAGSRPLRGTVRVPGDKSISHRALLLAGVAEGRTRLAGLATGDDVARTRGLLEACGVRIKGSASRLRVVGTGWDGIREPDGVVGCGNSGTTLRIGLGWLAGRPFHTVLTGDASLSRRPMLRVVEPLRAMGASIDGRSDARHTPLAIRGGGLTGRRHELSVASAQVKSALLLAGLQAEGTTEVVEPGPSRDHTERMLSALGVPVRTGESVAVEAATVPGFEMEIPGDPSSAAFFVVGALVTPGSEVTVEGVALNPRRTAYLEVLARMGAAVEVEQTGEALGEPYGTIRAASCPLEGTVVEGDEIPRVIDEIPALAVAAAFAATPTEVRDAEELRVKETDRIGAIEQELSQMGVDVEARRDGLVIRGGRPCAGRFKSHGDHRIAMAAAVAANACDGESRVQGWGAVASSYPEFADDLERLTAST